MITIKISHLVCLLISAACVGSAVTCVVFLMQVLKNIKGRGE